LIAGFILTATAAAADTAYSDQAPLPSDSELTVAWPAAQPGAGNPKLDSSLNQLVGALEMSGTAGTQAYAQAHLLPLDGERVQVEITTTAQAIPGLKEAIEAIGAEYQGHYQGLLEAWVPIDQLESVSALPEVGFARVPQFAIPDGALLAGDVTTEGVAASNIAAWHSAGYDGTGIRISIIDGGFLGYTGLLGTELPALVNTYDWTGNGFNATRHGTAVAEIIHDMAPGAALDLHVVNTTVQLSQAVNQAIADGVDILSMSVSWPLDGPGDGTGILADIMNDARSAGILPVKSAGNWAEVAYTGTYVNRLSQGRNLHAWDGSTRVFNYLGPGDHTTCIIPPLGSRVAAVLHWDDWDQVDQDYDLHVFRLPRGGSGLYLVGSSTDPQNGGPGQVPWELVSITASGNDCYAFAIERVNASRDVCFRLLAPGGGHLDYWTPARSLAFPADAPAVLAVAAVDAQSPYSLQFYSSRGPTFAPGGTCQGGAIKPDLAGYANVSTASYGTRVFDGTSAATPHVAGAAAVAWQSLQPASPAAVQSALETAGLDQGPAGKDNQTGAGRLFLGNLTNGDYKVYLPIILR
jgi:hypothetical protein